MVAFRQFPDLSPPLRLIRAILLALMLAPAGLIAQSEPAAAACGEDQQPPCQVQKARTPCWGCSGSFCGACFYDALECNRPELYISGGLCIDTASRVSAIPTEVDFMDGTRHVTQGYIVKIDLAEGPTVLIPNLEEINSCKNTRRGEVAFPSPMRTVPEDPNMLTVPDWAESSIYRSRLAVNGSFFEVHGYYDTGNVHDEVCTHVFGYTLSNKTLVRGEEQIKYYVGNSAAYADAGTLVFYTAGWDKYAQIWWYPMFPPGDPNKVPPYFQNAISGTQLLKDGAYVGDSVAAPSPDCAVARTAAGLSQDGRYLFLVTVNTGESAGCNNPSGTTMKSLAEYLQRAGAHNAISLDGGGSAQLYYSDRRITRRTLPSDKVSLPGFDPNKRYFR